MEEELAMLQVLDKAMIHIQARARGMLVRKRMPRH